MGFAIPFDPSPILSQAPDNPEPQPVPLKIAVGGWAMTSEEMVTLFGVRSPLVVEYEESCHRAGRPIGLKISLGGQSRLVDAAGVVALSDVESGMSSPPCLPCAFVPERRRELALAALENGLSLAPALLDPTAVVSRSSRIGAGSFVNAGAIIGAVTLTGEGVFVNRAASIGHHCVLGEFVSIGPGATLASNVVVGDLAMIGAGATVLPNIRIGAGAVVAAGSLVRANVADNAFVAGNPARERPFDRAKSSLYADGEE